MTTLRFGKLATKNDYRTLRLKNYVATAIAPPPANYDVLQKVYSKLGISDPKVLFPMDGNDQYGDCTIAALAHAATVYNGLVGQKQIMKTNDIEKLYFKLTGGADSGLNELVVLNYWQSNAVNGEKILAFAKIDHKNHTAIKQAINIFGGVYIGFQVQANADADFLAGKPWTPGKLTNHGHAVFAVGYDDNYLTVLTWGNTQKATWGWWDECVDEAYAIIPPEAKSIAFDGLNLAQLKADLKEVAS